MTAYLQHGNRKYRLPKDVCTIGREYNCSLFFDDELMSRRHAYVVRSEGRFLLIDHNSSNGVLVNNRRVDHCFLEDGDQVAMGSQHFVFHEEADAETPPPKADAPAKGDPNDSLSQMELLEQSMKENTLESLKTQMVQRDDAYTRLLILYKVTRIVTSVLDLDELLSKVVDLALEVINADRGLIMLLDDKNDLVTKVSRTRDKEQIESGLLQISRSIAQYTFQRRKPILTEDALIDNRFSSSGSIQLFNIRSAMCVPLVNKGNVLGVLYVDKRIQSHCFADSDLKMLISFADQVALAIDNSKLIADLKKSLDQIQRQQDALIQSEKMAAMGQLSAGVAHEIRNPLTAISGYVQYYFSKYKPEDPFYNKMKVMEQALTQINRIVEGLLGFSRTSKTSMEPCSLNEVIEATLVLAEHPLSRYSQVQVQRAFSENLLPVMADKRQLQQVFLNFMMNAAQAMPSGGNLTIKTQVIPDAFGPGVAGVTVAFRDTGCGIPAEKRDKIFQPFFTEGKKGGTGLGLSISKGIIDKHKGKIALESEIGKGTVFYLTFPAALRQDPQPSQG